MCGNGPRGRYGCRIATWSREHVLLAIVTLAMLDGPVPFTVFLLGFGIGNANLIAWTLLATLARGALPFGLFTMLSKLALGGSGLMMVACLNGEATLDGVGFRYLAAATAWFDAHFGVSGGRSRMALAQGWASRVTSTDDRRHDRASPVPAR